MSLDVHISEPDEINCQELHSAVEYLAEKHGIANFEYHVDYISGKRVNYISNVFRVIIKEGDSDSNEKDICVIVKTLGSLERQTLFHELHIREVDAYTKIVQKYQQFQKDLDEDKRLVLSKSLYTNTDKFNEVIVLEDLKEKGFVIDDKLAHFQDLGFDQVSCVLSELAKFHALSFVFDKLDAEKFNEVKTGFQDVLYQDAFLMQNKLRSYFFDSFEMSLKLVTDTEAKKKLENVKDNVLKALKMYTTPDEISVLCHGDCWMSNMLFKTEENTTKVCFIDLQTMRYANPTTDIMHFLYICTNSIFRSEYFNQLMDIYYTSLTTFLNLFDIDAKTVYPREKFQENLTQFSPYGFLIAMIELKLVSMTPEDDAILKGSKLMGNTNLLEVPGEIELYKFRVNDVVNEAVANGALDNLIESIKGLPR